MAADDRSSRTNVTRRALLAGSLGVVALAGAAVFGVEQNLIPGRTTFYRDLGLDGPKGVIPNAPIGPMMTGSFTSTARLGKKVSWAASLPPGIHQRGSLPILIVLHGAGGTHASAFGDYLGLDQFLGAAVMAGHPPFAIASIDGGDTYWHKRTSGEDAGAMVAHEFPLILGNAGLDVTRTGLLGWSMGGYGALHVAGTSGAGLWRCVIAESPAFWDSEQRAARGAFDNATNFAENTVFGRQESLDGIATRIDCGIGDGFFPAAEAYTAGFAMPPAGEFAAGGHNTDFWRRMAPAQLAFAAKNLV